ncbi:NucA/NucB deoxyribonuclease domain-containing protein [Saccharothrix violaceirubra]|uniref:Deoxyribonuclease NucA/NucB domain-containing protein n=1 Tax=Saccharothrix violaceirubra TaxID=413306 RepID=A0A7W7WZC4_9PSEU|nr:hypothetical protein [Saccharothrix violaceirubra]MBB4968836.1 hypothetical protein [Saccharothrix violaceirubra]
MLTHKDSVGVHPAASNAEYDYYAPSECGAFDPRQDEQEVRRKNHFAFCLVSRPRYRFYRYIGRFPVLVGEATFRIMLIGYGERGVRRMRFELDVDDWDGWGFQRDEAPLEIKTTCLNLPQAECDTVGGGRASTIRDWKVRGYDYATFVTARSPGGGDGANYDQDKVNYHQMRLEIVAPTGSGRFDQSFRCDSATYAGGGACIFHEVEAVMQYRLSGDGVDEIAAHIKKAQEDPGSMYPGGAGTAIPGGYTSGRPLTRLYSGMDDESRRYYDANNRIARNTCEKFDPNYGKPGLQCDEYPFRSTWEGAYSTAVDPQSRWKYSARMVDGDQNGKAGSDLGVWYTQDHILAKDAFWVSIR